MRIVDLELWAVVTEQGDILYTDKEACIYADHKTAVKEQGSHFIKKIFVSYKV